MAAPLPRSPRPARPARRLLAVAATTALLVLAGCGADTGEKAGGGSGDGTPTTDGGGAPAKELTIEQLRSLVPTAKDLPDDYRTAPKDDDSDDDETDQAIRDACPDAEVIEAMSGDSDTDDSKKVEKSYATGDQRELEFTLTLDSSKFPEDKAPEFIDAINACDDIHIADPEQGDLTMDLGAEPLDLGDYGMTLTGEITLEVQGETLEISLRTRIFVEDGIGISVGSTSGLDSSDYSTIDADDDVADQLAEDLDAKVRDLTE